MQKVEKRDGRVAVLLFRSKSPPNTVYRDSRAAVRKLSL